MDFPGWSKSEFPAAVVDLREAGSLLSILEGYAAIEPNVLEEILGQIYELGAQMAIIEYRYLDADYRNEHSRFYSTTFRRYPSVAHRLHFFCNAPPPDFKAPKRPTSFKGLDYLGYCVLRPVPGAPVARTMIRPPTELAPWVSVASEDKINLFGADYSVCGTPFMAQDAQLSRCAHAVAWMVSYYHHLRFDEPRFLPGDIADAVPVGAGVGRDLPSQGLRLHEISAAFNRIGLPALVYDLEELPEGETLFKIACRYLNSRLPVMVAGGGHAWVLVGYRATRTSDDTTWIQFIRHDDEEGPYQLVDNPFLDRYNPWEYLIIPLPKKVYLSGESAEAVGQEKIQVALAESEHKSAPEIISRINDHQITFRSSVLPSNDFKQGLRRRGLPEEIETIYSQMHLPRWVWVVEATVRDERDKNDPSVVAEAIIDATDHLKDLHCLAWRTPGELSRWLPDRDKVQGRSVAEVPLVITVAANGSAESEMGAVT